MDAPRRQAKSLPVPMGMRPRAAAAGAPASQAGVPRLASMMPLSTSVAFAFVSVWRMTSAVRWPAPRPETGLRVTLIVGIAPSCCAVLLRV